MRSSSSLGVTLGVSILVGALASACSSGAPAAGPSASDGEPRAGEAKQPIIGGTTDTKHSAVVALLMIDSSNPGAFGTCTGSIVKVSGSVGYVLTAAHCCGGDPQNAGMKPSLVVAANDYGPYEQDLGNPNPAPPSYPVIAGSVAYDSAYNGMTHDFCMLQFSGASASTPTLKLPTASDGLTQGASVEFVGYGKTSGSSTNQNSVRYHVTANIDQQLSSLAVRYSESNGGPCEGDSGGPALYPAGVAQSQQTVVAATSYGDPSCASYGVSSRVSSAMGAGGFISSYLAGTPLPPPPPASSCSACQSKALSAAGACQSAIQACESDASCVALASCVQNCDPNDSACIQGCASKNSKGISAYVAIDDCVCNTGCVTECASQCSSSSTPSSSGSDAGAKKPKDAGAKADGGSADEPTDEVAADDDAGAANRATTTTTTSGCAISGTPSSASAPSVLVAVASLALGAGRRRRQRR